MDSTFGFFILSIIGILLYCFFFKNRKQKQPTSRKVNVQNTAHFQRAVSCDVKDCENPAKYQCLNCEDALCIKCKDKHEEKRPTHKFVLYSERSKRNCKEHTDSKNVFWCKTCKVACCAKCSITSHKRHDFDDIEDAIRDKKVRETQNLQGPFQECLTKWRTLLEKSREMTEDYKESVQKIDQELVAHAARIHEIVDKAVDKVRSKLRQISENQEMTLQTQENAINDKFEKFKRNIRQLEELLQINDISLLEYELEIADMEAVPTLFQQSPPNYTRGQIDDTVISTMIGKLNKFEKEPLLSTPVVVSSFNPGYDYPDIACTTSSSQTWVKTGKHSLQLMDRDGAVLDTIHTDFGFDDVTVTPQKDVLFSDWENKCIVSASKEGTSWKITSLLSTQYQPWGICSLRNGDVVVTYHSDNRIIEYSRKGDIIYEFDPKLFSGPCSVTENKVNEDVYVSDNKLLAFSKDHTLRYEYEGSDSLSFVPYDVSTDMDGRVLVTDMRNNRVHVLDKDGKFLQYIQLIGLKEPYYIDVDSEGNAWIGECKGQVKIVRYLNDNPY